MEQKTERLYHSAPLMGSDNEIQQRLEKKTNAVTNFKNHISNIKEMITYVKNKNHKSKQKYKK